MYDHVFGFLKSSQGREIVVRVAGVGYTLQVSAQTLKAAESFDGQAEILFYVHYQILADQGEARLYGFLSLAERGFFRTLLKVSGIGPGTAIRVMDAGSVEDLRRMIREKDVAALRKLQGIGPKTAAKIVTELAGA